MVFDAGLFRDDGSRIIRPSEADVAVYGRDMDRREFLNYMMAVPVAAYYTALTGRKLSRALRGAGIGAASSDCGGNPAGSTPAFVLVDGELLNMMTGERMMPYRAALDARVFNSSDGAFAFNDVPTGQYNLAAENLQDANAALGYKRLREKMKVSDRTNVKLYGIPPKIGFNEPHNDEITVSPGLGGQRARFPEGVLPIVYAVKTYRDASGNVQFVGDNVIKNTEAAVDTINKVLNRPDHSLLKLQFETPESRPPENVSGTIIVDYNQGPSGGPAPTNYGYIIWGVARIPLLAPVEVNLHELLHVLGFGHTSARDSIMLSGRLPSSPSRDDILSMLYKYSHHPNAGVEGGIDRD